jgi:hypothetical protein
MSVTRWLVGGAAALALAAAGCAQLGLHRPADENTPETVRVELRDTRIDVSPHMVARGKVILEIENDGELEHGLRVVGPGVDEQSDEFLVPGQHRRVTMKLGEGTFRIFCPDGNHADLGMWSQIVVTDSSSWFRR